ncbi:MAG: bifunctional phosphoribosyl-AMP cyclohydrolase/phosphoribosyl-ATP diphosphatase HisIE [Oscillospiraceae bacterium]|jgi:phosphoribosyl-ATP pyrophosphohydrolase/phosphoribosyl-AMP cyclohydrolase|nr:bifunctional phosphoribosyl-AMP cyclohydrolase/phosphoribosyl-ATP diphosphatase HisIE [Oscillospiraceae bacterium]
MNVKFDRDGLIPAVVQDVDSGRVLTLAYMNEESLRISLAEGRTCFFSRSRQQLWRKGETSGNTQKIVRISADCDADALLVEVRPAGPACHTGEDSCFHQPLYNDGAQAAFSLEALYQLIAGRRETPQPGSYTSYLFEKGKEKILKKVGEECAEVVIGAMKGSETETVYEIADLCYHVMVLMAEMGITPEAVLRELAGRHVIDHKVKQETPQGG